MRLLLLDTETSSLDPDTGHLLEVATAIYSVEHRSLTRVRSWLVQAPGNDAEPINGIPPALVADPDHACSPTLTDGWVQTWAADCAAILAFNSDFDRQWFGGKVTAPWVDAQEFAFPKDSTSRSLVARALAHGLGVGSAHRALDDVLLLARLLTRAAELGMSIEEQVTRGLRPRALFQVAATDFDRARNELAKQHGFRFDDPTKTWRRRMPIEETSTLPFAVKEVAA